MKNFYKERMINLKLTKLFAASMSFVMLMTSAVNVGFAAENKNYAEEIGIYAADDVESAAAVEDDTVPENEIVTLAASTFTDTYAVEGGNIYFDANTGTITSCDTSITTANIPAEINGIPVTSIDQFVFYSCTDLTNVTIPSSITNIGDYALSGSTGLVSISVDEENTYYSSDKGVLFNKDKTKLITYPCSKTDSVYTIPDSTTEIADAAFYKCKILTSAIIPDSVTSLGIYVFADCTALTDITIPNGVTKIPNYAFCDCTSLSNIIISNSASQIGNFAFYGCSSLTNITMSESVTSIGEAAFYACTGLTDITIPTSVKSIGSDAFSYCSSLTSITIPGSITKISSYAFSCSGLTSVVIEDGVTSIGYASFSTCSNLTNVTIPDSVTNIGNGAFYACSSLTSVTIPNNVTSIGSDAFAAGGLKTVYCYKNSTADNTSLYPDGVTIIYLDSDESTTESETETETATETETETETETATETETETATETTTICTIRFSNTGESSIENITVVGGSTVELPTPERSGYVFKGWYTDSSYETPFTSTDVVTSNLRLYAKWNELVTISFDSNGGSDVESMEVEAGETMTLPESTKDGCTFEGWYSDSLWSDEFTEETEVPYYDKTLYAKFVKTLPTESEIKAKYQSLNLSTISNIYSSTPSVTAPYSAGTLTDSFIKTGIDYLNFIRFVSGLQEVSIDDTYEEYAQYSAAIQAIIGGNLNHYPDQPSDMDDDFYEKAYYGSRRGNLGAGYGRNLGYEVQGFLDDDSSSNNLSTVGHRRWVLNPYMLYAGFGYVENSSSYYGSYGSMYAHDESNEDVDFYDFIAYPSQGNFPEDLISNSVPWSVSLNSSLYKVESANDINVSVTKVSSGKKWTFSQADYESSPSVGSKYFTYDNVGYGIDSCIIFGFGSSNISSSDLDGEFTVNITGLKDSDGNDTSIEYSVNFFSLNSSYEESTETTTKSSSSSGGGGGGGSSSVSSTTYTISFNAQNGTDITSKAVVKNRTVSEPTDPTYEGYIFTGWYTDSGCTKAYDFTTKVTSSFTLYAGWEKAEASEDTDEANAETETANDKTGLDKEIRVSIGSSYVSIDGKSYAMEAAPYIQTSSSSTLVPLRFVAIAILGDDIENADDSSIIGWNAATKTASITANGNVIQFTANSNIMNINGNPVAMDNGVIAEITDGRMYIPFRALGNALGVDVDWDSDTKTAIYKTM